MPERKYKTSENITVRQLRDFIVLEEAVKNGDIEAAKEISEMDDVEEYRELAADYQELMKGFGDGFQPVIDNVLNTGEFAESQISSLSGILEDLTGSSQITDHALDGFRDIQSDEFIVPPDFSYAISSPQDRVADEIAESNRLQREILQLLKEKGTTETFQRANPKNIFIPKRSTDLKRWKVIWKWIRGKWAQDPNLTNIKSWMDKMHPDYSPCVETLRKIVRAGDAGLID